ncbi:MAG: hypothetical protein Q7J31_19055 [Syntrophales bacterium]|nr:hypothetical protein [Syntrophales bacterium]
MATNMSETEKKKLYEITIAALLYDIRDRPGQSPDCPVSEYKSLPRNW